MARRRAACARRHRLPGAVAPPGDRRPGDAVVTMADLGLRPTDLLSLVGRDTDQAMSELDDRVLARVLATGAVPRPDAALEIRYAERPATGVSVFEVAPLVRRLRELLDRARPLRPSDVALGADAAAEADARVTARRSRVAAVRDDLAALAADMDDAVTTAAASSDAAVLAGIDGLVEDAASAAGARRRVRHPGDRMGLRAAPGARASTRGSSARCASAPSAGTAGSRPSPRSSASTTSSTSRPPTRSASSSCAARRASSSTTPIAVAGDTGRAARRAAGRPRRARRPPGRHARPGRRRRRDARAAARRRAPARRDRSRSTRSPSPSTSARPPSSATRASSPPRSRRRPPTSRAGSRPPTARWRRMTPRPTARRASRRWARPPGRCSATSSGSSPRSSWPPSRARSSRTRSPPRSPAS